MKELLREFFFFFLLLALEMFTVLLRRYYNALDSVVYSIRFG